MASQVVEKVREISIENALGLTDLAEEEEREIATLSKEIDLLEKQIGIRERQENLLRFEC